MAEEQTKKKILIVDDEPSSLLLLKSSLVKGGFAVVTGSNGQEALSQVKVESPDLVILDRMMPKMDGIKACALLKVDKRFTKIPVIMLTASAEKEDQKLSMEVGANGFLNKPLNPTELFQKINELLGQS